MARRPGPTRRPLTLRVRITLATTVVAAVALVTGAVVFGVVLRTSLLDAVAASAETYASDLSEGSGPSLSSSIAELDDDDRFVQLRNDDGAVVAASDGADGVPSVSESDTEARRIVSVDGDDYLVVAEETDDGTLVVGQSVEDAAEAVATVTAQLAVAVPLVVLLMAATTWVVVGRALRPVERMRREVAAVTASRLDRRIAEPGTDDEIGRLAATMNGMLDRLDASQSAQRRFISDASHELRSPLSSLRQFAEVARAHPDRVDAADLSEAILDEGARLERLVDGMLALARADEQVLVSAAAPVDLDDIVLAEVRRLRASGGVRIDASAVGAARIAGDAGLLSGLVRNLVDNAARHAASELRIELAETQDGVTFAVDDDGPGVPERERERIFDRFVRLDDARAREAGGSGLGLAIAREIALAHGGTVTAHTSTLGGARFEVLLPASSE